MSRIHEALKKAAQEKTSQLSGRERLDVAPVAVDIPEAVMPPSKPAEGALEGPWAPAMGPFFRFEDLVKRCGHPEWKPDPRLSLFHQGDNARLGAERFRTLRSRLYQIAATKPLRKVLVTSSLPSEGKTFVATNLAHSIVSQPDRRVLLIDSDLRVPRLHTELGAPSSPGLADYLRGEADEYTVIQQGPESNLCFIPCGRIVSNPSELLSGDRMKSLLDTVAPMFDWVILDSPPTVPVHDASILADLCDGVLFVVKAGETSCETAEKAASEFRQKNLLGVVLNQIEKSQSNEDHYSGYLGEEK
jgi:protein-tyrosine kinase